MLAGLTFLFQLQRKGKKVMRRDELTENSLAQPDRSPSPVINISTSDSDDSNDMANMLRSALTTTLLPKVREEVKKILQRAEVGSQTK